MITRTAVFEGRVKPGREEAFFRAVTERLVPLWQQFPHALGVRWSRTVGADEGAPPVVMIQQVDYPSRAALAEALSSPVRAAARAITLEILEDFEGRLYHFVGEVADPPAGR